VPSSSSPSRWGVLLRWTFGLAGIAFLIIAFRETSRRSHGLPIPRAWAFVSAAALILFALVCLARAWARLVAEHSPDRALSARFYASQLGRYVPGAVWQALAQVGLATRSGIPLPAASTAFGVHALVQVAAGGTIGAGLAIFGGSIPVAIRVVTPFALLSLLLLRRPLLLRALHVVGRLTGRAFADALVPPQPAILASFAWTLGSVLASSTAFALLLVSLPDGGPVLAGVTAFSLAWTVGFVAIPFPSGIGIREAILLVTIGFAVPRSHVIAASVFQRLVLMVADTLAIISSRVSLGFRDRSTIPGGPAAGSG
jgi:glycosyltransferase 2 family protein